MPSIRCSSVLYGKRDDFEQQLVQLAEVLALNYIKRDKTLKLRDIKREHDHNWFLSQEWVGMALYANALPTICRGLGKRLGYLQELGVNMLHVMPILKCPPGASDGGYAVSDYRSVDERVGDLEDLNALVQKLRKRDMLLTLDVVVNHVSDQHEWAQQGARGRRVSTRIISTPFPTGKYRTCSKRPCRRFFPKMHPVISPGTNPWSAG